MGVNFCRENIKGARLNYKSFNQFCTMLVAPEYSVFAVLLQNTQHPSKYTSESEDDSPLAMWFAEITQSLKTNSAERCEGIYNVTVIL